MLTGVVEYGLAKKVLLAGLELGIVRREEVCDAHPELLRAAGYFGNARADEPCPVCRVRSLREVAYVFSPALRGKSGRAWRRAELDRLKARRGVYRCFIVEVCTGCGWNHLVRSFYMGRGLVSREQERARG
jgi:hypothetical protein